MFNARSTLRGPTRVGRGHRACGAGAARGYPLGGGPGYAETVGLSSSPVRHLDELIEALAGARAGDTVYVAGDVVIECTERVYIEELILETAWRCDLGQRSRLQGGPWWIDPLRHLRHESPHSGHRARMRVLPASACRDRTLASAWSNHSRSFREGHGGARYYYRFPTSAGIEARYPRLRVDNCELAGWSPRGRAPSGRRRAPRAALLHPSQPVPGARVRRLSQQGRNADRGQLV